MITFFNFYFPDPKDETWNSSNEILCWNAGSSFSLAAENDYFISIKLDRTLVFQDSRKDTVSLTRRIPFLGSDDDDDGNQQAMKSDWWRSSGMIQQTILWKIDRIRSACVASHLFGRNGSRLRLHFVLTDDGDAIRKSLRDANRRRWGRHHRVSPL